MWRFIGWSLPTLMLLLWAHSAHAQGAVNRLPLPEGESLDNARQIVADVYKKEWDSAKTLTQRLDLARKLFTDAEKTRDDPTARYALLLAAQNLASQMGNAPLVCNIIDTQAHHYDIDATKAKVAALDKLTTNLKLERDHYLFTQQAEQLLPDLIKTGSWETARKLVGLAQVAARKARDTDLAKVYESRIADLTAQQKATEMLSVKLMELEESPADSLANEAAGKMFCFALDDWSRGLPMLALSADKQLQALAEADLRAGSEAEKLDVADRWTKYAATREGLVKRSIQRHALELYMPIQRKLSGLNRTRVDNEVRTLFREAMPDRVPLSVLTPKRYDVFDVHRGPYLVGEVGGYKFPHSVWSHPPNPHSTAIIEYDLPCEFKYIIGFCGFHADVKPDTAAVFRVIGSDVGDIFRTKEPFGASGTLLPFRADLRGRTRMDLAIECHGSHGQVWSIWVSPMLQK